MEAAISLTYIILFGFAICFGINMLTTTLMLYVIPIKVADKIGFLLGLSGAFIWGVYNSDDLQTTFSAIFSQFM